MTDSDGFDEFYLATRVSLLRQLTAMTADRELAATVLPEAYARAWQRWNRVATLPQPTAWVRTVAWRLSLRPPRARARRRVVLVDDTVDISTAFRLLSPDLRRGLVLHGLCGMSEAAIAVELGVSQAAVASRLASGRSQLATLVGTSDLDAVPVLTSYAGSAREDDLPSGSTIRLRGRRRARRTRLEFVVAAAAGLALVSGLVQVLRTTAGPHPVAVHALPIVPRAEAGLAYFTSHAQRDLAVRVDPAGPAHAVVSEDALDEVCYGGCQILRDSWSPDARRVAAVVATGPTTAKVLLIDHGKASTLFDCPGHTSTGCDWDVSDLSWSPDGDVLAFSSGRVPYLFVIATRELHRIQCQGCAVWSPQWSPDGAWLTYLAADGVYRGIFGGFPDTRIARTKNPTLAVLSPDRTRLAIGAAHGVRIVAVDDGHTITSLRLTYNAVAPAWSPDGRHLAVLRDNVGSGVPQILVCDAAGRHLHSVHRFNRFNGASNLAWSPDGRRIAIGLSRIDDVNERWQGAVAVIDSRSGRVLHEFPGFGPVAWLSR